MHFLNFGLTSSAPEVTKFANQLFAECVEPTYSILRPKIKAKAIDQLVRLLANLYRAEYNRRFGTSPDLRYSRSKSGYTDFYSFSYDILITRLIESLSPKYLTRVDTCPDDKYLNAYAELSAIYPTMALTQVMK